MDKIFKIIFAVAVAAAFVSCTKGGDEPENTPTPTPTPDKKAPFKVEVLDITATEARVSVSPEDKATKYYFDILREEYYTEYNEQFGFQRFIDNTVKSLMETNNMTKEEVLSRILSAGDDSYGFTNLKAGSVYYAVAMGVDNKGLLSTDVVSTKFTTQDAKVSDNTFQIDITKTGYDSVTYSVTPKNSSDKYVLIVWNKPVVDSMSSEEFIAHCLKSRSDIESYVVSGKQAGTITECFPGRDYYLVVFGYEGGLATTEVSKAPFTTKSGGDAAQCKFTFEVSSIQYDRAYMKVTPSTKYNVFFWGVVEKTLYEQRSAEMGAHHAMESVLEESLKPFAQDFGNIHDALEMVSSYGEVSVEGTTYGLQQGTEYIPWAVCIDNNGKAIADFAMGESFTTKSDTVAECKVSVKGSFFAGDDGLAVVRSTATPDSKCAGFYNVIFQGDLTGAERQTLLNNIIRDPYFKNRKVVEFAKCAWGQPVSAVAVGFDSDGNFGEIAIDVFTPTKE